VLHTLTLNHVPYLYFAKYLALLNKQSAEAGESLGGEGEELNESIASVQP
jgi:hypothetical protein